MTVPKEFNWQQVALWLIEAARYSETTKAGRHTVVVRSRGIRIVSRVGNLRSVRLISWFGMVDYGFNPFLDAMERAEHAPAEPRPSYGWHRILARLGWA